MRHRLLMALLILPALPALAARPAKQHAPPAVGVRTADEPARALFEESDSARARKLAAAVLTRTSTPQVQLAALFVEMEAAALQADDVAMLRAALRLCEAAGLRADARAEVAAARILDRAQNSQAFSAISAHVQTLAGRDVPVAATLRAALLAAATDGASLGETRALAHAAGFVTDWKLAGPFGKYPNVDFDRSFAPERGTQLAASYAGRATENFVARDGRFDLPSYYAERGVFYASGEFESMQPQVRFRLESPGTAAVFVDGALVLVRDDRLESRPAAVVAVVSLRPGRHRVLVKFLPNAAPWRLAVLPAVPDARAADVAASAREANYLPAAQRYWSGDPEAAVALLRPITQPSAVESWLLAQALAPLDTTASAAALAAAQARDPQAYAVVLARARRAAEDGHDNEAAQSLRGMVKARPESAEAQRLLAQVGDRLRAPREAAAAYAAAVALHPACDVLQAAARLAQNQMRLADATGLRQRLQGCAPGSLAYANSLADAGKHSEAAHAAHAVVAAEPLARDARALEARELWLAGEHDAAGSAARDLHCIAPNAAVYARLVEATANDASTLPDDNNGRDPAFAGGEEFFAPYRRDGVKAVRAAAERVFSGGPAVVLLSDRVAQLRRDGASAVYVHRITRVISRDGIEQYGEVALPTGARLLELRTIKPDGTFVEPELTQAKSTISMPALAPGDAIEQEYVLYYRERGIEDHAEDFRADFGSFQAPILTARFVLLAPADATPALVTANGAPAGQTRTSGGNVIRTWERNDIAQSLTEPALPPTNELLPSVRVVAPRTLPWSEVVDYWRDAAIEAAQAGPRVNAIASGLTGSEEERARQLYRRVLGRVTASDGSLMAGANAEETLAVREGNRTAVLLAAARVAGLRAALVMARAAGGGAPQVAFLGAYTRPLVEFRFGARRVLVDAESDGFAFGQLAPGLAPGDALFVGELQAPAANASIVALTQPTLAREQSTADADVSLDADGALSAKVRITLGRWRSTQLRATLRALPASERQHFFEQLAGRIFPGVSEAMGEARNADDPELPLELNLTCRAPHYVALLGTTVELDQIVPTLGLRKMFAESNDRKFPLLIESVLQEASTFRVHLPRGVRIAELPASHEVKMAFGSYKAEFKAVGPNEFVVSRSFNVPAQTIEPEKYREFARFAERIDAAERERIVVAPEVVTSAAKAASF